MQAKQRRATATIKKPSNPHYSKRLWEAVLIITIAASLFIVLALATYHSSDPGWSRTSSNSTIINLGGFVGAWLADILFYIFGFVAYLFPLLLAYAAWMPLQYWSDSDGGAVVSNGLRILRTIGAVLVLFMGSSLASSYFIAHYLPAGAGGIIGILLSQHMFIIFNVFGANLLMLALFLVGITLFSGLSWIWVIDTIGRLTLFLMATIGGLTKKLLQHKPKAKESYYDLAEIKPIKVKPIITKPTKVEPEKVERPALKLVPQRTGGYIKPPIDLLDEPEAKGAKGYSREQLATMSQEVELHLREFGIDAHVVAVYPGPVVTRFELALAAGTKASKITNIATDLARSLSVMSVRVVEVIPGKSVIGLELPNDERELVRLREIIASKQFKNAHSPLALALGKDISGHPVVVDLAKMPHLLVAGTTGSGKSVGLNAILLSLMYKYSPKNVRIIMIDPKMLELSVYEGIPHLLAPVVTDMKEAANALRWCVAEMERRYKLMAALGVRNIAGYNIKVQEARKKGAPLLDPLKKAEAVANPEELQELPSIVVLADEFADMIMVVGKKVEELITRIAQKARAAGIHLILATQRPSVDVITGLVKANIPSRIAFQVSSKIDSRTILDQMGAEQLLGFGDMLYLPPGTVIPIRVHGAFVADEEVHRVVGFLKQQGMPEYVNAVTEGTSEAIPGIDSDSGSVDDPEQDAIYDEAVEFVVHSRRVSISSVQRRFKIGYNRAARIVEAMEAAGVVSNMESNGNREVLVPARGQ